ncbi:DegT/DnrJ/EryC1/StrS family aminotransferase [bacterium]|nr:DegT/DnrJ/EryC1/StrS family aminotransferase [bacterium]
MGRLAINGGKPVREKSFPIWPVCDEKEAEAVRQVALSGKWWRGAYSKSEFDRQDTGEERSKIAEFEENFARHHHAKYAVAVASGSAALEISVRALGIGAGDEVITTPYTFIATTTCILNNNAVPVYVDIDHETYNINADLIERAITPRTKAIIPVHFSGDLCDMEKINILAMKYNLKVIEDAAHAHGVELDGEKMAGTFGDLGVFSFQSAKNMASGEGGIIITNNEELADICFSLHHYGRVKDGLWYEHHRLGWNYRMAEFQAAILLVQLSRLDKLNRIRMKNAEYLYEKISKIDGIKPCRINTRLTKHSHHIFMLRYDATKFGNIHRDKFVEALNAEGIPALTGYTFPNYANPFMQSQIFKKGECPVVEKACNEEAIWLEHRLLLGDRNDMDDIVKAFEKIKENCTELQ